MMRSPSLNSACASTPTLGSATTAMGADGPAAGGLWPQPAKARSRAATLLREATLLVTPHLFDSFEGDARLAHARHQANLVLLRVLVLGQARQRLPDRLRVL